MEVVEDRLWEVAGKGFGDSLLLPPVMLLLLLPLWLLLLLRLLVFMPSRQP